MEPLNYQFANMLKLDFGLRMSPPLIDVSDDDDSITYLGAPLKPTPLIVEVDNDEELILNVSIPSQSLNYHCQQSKTTPVTPMRPSLNFSSSSTISMRNSSSESQNGEESSSDVISPYHWTDEMKTYYNDDWGDEDSFTLDELQREMKPGRRFWNTIMPHKPKNKRCFKCNTYHKKSESCPDGSSCYMCGTDGHKAHRCPHRMCLTCGKRTNLFLYGCASCRRKKEMKCKSCSFFGHSIIDCTDNWRRFHHITCDDPFKAPEMPIQKPLQEIWCCNCGRQGHIDAYCYLTRECNEHPISSTLVVSYEGAFNAFEAGALRRVTNNHRTLDLSKLESSNIPKRGRYFDNETDNNPKRQKSNHRPTEIVTPIKKSDPCEGKDAIVIGNCNATSSTKPKSENEEEPSDIPSLGSITQDYIPLNRNSKKKRKNRKSKKQNLKEFQMRLKNRINRIVMKQNEITDNQPKQRKSESRRRRKKMIKALEGQLLKLPANTRKALSSSTRGAIERWNNFLLES